MLKINNTAVQTLLFTDKKHNRVPVNVLRVNNKVIDIGYTPIELFNLKPINDIGDVVEESICTAYMIGNDSEEQCNGYIGEATEIKLPLMYNNKPIIKIGKYAFSSSKITKISIPYTYKYIDNNAFENSELREFDSMLIQSIGEKAFNASKLERINLKKALTNVGNYAFANIDENLRYVYFNCPDLIVNQSNYIFSYSGNTANSVDSCILEIGNDVTKLPNFIFNPDLSLTFMQDFRVSKVLLNNVKDIGIAAFAMAFHLHEVDLSNVETIKQLGFAVAPYYLENVDLYKAKEVGASAFFLCDALKTAFINKDAEVFNNSSQPTFSSTSLTIYTDAESLPTSWNAELFADKNIVYNTTHEQYLEIIKQPKIAIFKMNRITHNRTITLNLK